MTLGENLRYFILQKPTYLVCHIANDNNTLFPTTAPIVKQKVSELSKRRDSMFFERDKREYARIRIHLPALITSKPYKETECSIIEISQEGMRLKVPAPAIRDLNLKEKDFLFVQFVDTYKFGREEITDTIQSRIQIRHIQTKGDYIEIGCLIKSPEFAEYVRRKKTLLSLEMQRGAS